MEATICPRWRTCRNRLQPALHMVGIIDLLAQCSLLGAEEKDPMQWYKCTSPRLRDASTSIKALLDSPYFAYMNNPKTAEIYQALQVVDRPIC